MGLTNEHVGPKILAKIKIYVLTRAELLFQVCYEIPCKWNSCRGNYSSEKLFVAIRYSQKIFKILVKWSMTNFLKIMYLKNHTLKKLIITDSLLWTSFRSSPSFSSSNFDLNFSMALLRFPIEGTNSQTKT